VTSVEREALRVSAGQFIRYSLVGVASNGIGLALYFLLTGLGVGPKSAMTGLYLLGVLQTFFFNKRWSFGHRGDLGWPFVRYCVSYAVGYLINLGGLILLVDRWGYSHRLVQTLMVPTLAVLLFCLQKFWVFGVGSDSQNSGVGSPA
jgi:putative flippase GtrA